MLLTLLKHQFLKAVRSGSSGRGCMVTVLMFIVGFFVLMYMIGISLYMETLITEILGEPDATGFMNRLLIYYFFGEIITRYFLQKLPVIDFESYLHLPVTRVQIVHYLLGKSFFSPFNIIVPLLFTPFAISTFGQEYGLSAAITWILMITALSWTIHYILIYFRRISGENAWLLLGLIIIMLTAVALDYFGIFEFGEQFAPLFAQAAQGPIPMLIMFTLLVGCYHLAYRFHFNNCYLDDLQPEKGFAGLSGNFSFLDNFGNIGDLIQLELKLIFRHKRARGMLYLSIIFLAYGLLFYPDAMGGEGMPRVMLIFLGVFITGIFIMQYGQFLLSWNSNFFDFFAVNPVSAEEYVSSKFYLLSGVSVICYILSVPYVYYGWEILVINTAMFVYNIGINTWLIIYLSMWGPQKLNLNQRSAFSFQGVGAAQWIMGFPVIIGPMLLYIPFAIWGTFQQAVITIFLIGILGIVFRGKFTALSAKRLNRLKYGISSSFRTE